MQKSEGAILIDNLHISLAVDEIPDDNKEALDLCNEILKDEMEKARRLISDNKEKVRLLADTLAEKNRLTGAAVEKMFKKLKSD